MKKFKKKILVAAFSSVMFITGIVGMSIASATTNNWLAVSFAEKKEAAYLGEKVELVTVTPVYPDRVQKIYYSVEAPNGETVTHDGNSFSVSQIGDYKIYVCVVGKNGETYVESYTMSATKSAAPILATAPAMPVAFLEGMTYDVPKASFLDYNQGMPASVDSHVYMVDEFGVESLLEDKFQPNVTLHGSEIGLKYVSQSKVTGEEIITTYFVPVLEAIEKDTYGNNLYSYDKMFVTKGVQNSETNKTGATFYGKNEFSLSYANKLQQDFSIAFKSQANHTNFSSVVLTLTDTENSSEYITIEIFNADATTVKINDGAAIAAKGSFKNFEKGFALRFDSKKLTLEDTDGGRLGEITKTAEGKDFKGFSSNFVCVDISVKRVGALSALTIVNLNGHGMTSNNTQDYILPYVEAASDFSTKNKLGDTVVLPEAFAYDVIDPSVERKISVFNKNGEVVMAKDGTFLFEAPADRPHEVVLNVKGEYTVQYIAIDINGNTYDYVYYSMFALDSVAPILEVEEITAKVKVGQEITIPKLTYSDNDTAIENLSVWIVVNKPYGNHDYVEQGAKYRFEEAGTYYIRYSVMDENNNITTVEHTVICK